MSESKTEIRSEWILQMFILALSSIFLSILFGITGFRFAIGVFLLYFPAYFVLRNFNMSGGEKHIFALVGGITLIPTLAFGLGFFISFRLSIAIVVAIFLLAGFLLSHFTKKSEPSTDHNKHSRE